MALQITGIFMTSLVSHLGWIKIFKSPVSKWKAQI